MLADGTYTYLYGLDRIGQNSAAGMAYFLPDALGSVRNLASSCGTVSLTRAYDPFGSLLNSTGSGMTSYGFAGEWTDQTGLQNLRARYYLPATGRFITRDSWIGDYSNPSTLNHYIYGLDNPTLFIDQDGHFPLLATALGGAAVGLVVDVLAQAIPQYIAGNEIKIDLAQAGGAAAAGFVAGLTLGVGTWVAGSSIATSAIAGGIGNAFGNQFGTLVQGALETNSSLLSDSAKKAAENHGGGDLVKFGVDFGVGAVAGTITHYVGTKINASTPKVITLQGELTSEGTKYHYVSEPLRTELGNRSASPNFKSSLSQGAFYRTITSIPNYLGTVITYGADCFRQRLLPQLSNGASGG